ncbi:MAG: hypothetical protein J6U92_00050 [Clostridia bacterium]|nr:hypothetical protein [Clostridia bacterium]
MKHYEKPEVKFLELLKQDVLFASTTNPFWQDDPFGKDEPLGGVLDE